MHTKITPEQIKNSFLRSAKFLFLLGLLAGLSVDTGFYAVVPSGRDLAFHFTVIATLTGGLAGASLMGYVIRREDSISLDNWVHVSAHMTLGSWIGTIFAAPAVLLGVAFTLPMAGAGVGWSITAIFFKLLNKN
jgi:hypothetical protein